nr:MAG TPA: hypothetical protein [Caudoviricetes sp.]
MNGWCKYKSPTARPPIGVPFQTIDPQSGTRSNIRESRIAELSVFSTVQSRVW